MTYNVFGGTLSLTQSINQPGSCAEPISLCQMHLMYVLIMGKVLGSSLGCLYALKG